MEERKTPIDIYVAYLLGGDVEPPSDLDDAMKAKAIRYVIQNKNHHRERVVKEIVSLFSSESMKVRGAAWSLIQMIPLYYLTYVPRLQRMPNTKSFKLSIVNKIANSSKEEILRLFFSSPRRYRELFRRLHLYTKHVKGEPITNENYLFAVSLLDKPTNEVVREVGIDELAKIVPLHTIMQYVESPEDVRVLAEVSPPQFYLEHIRWFSLHLGIDEASDIASKKIRELSDPLKFINVLDHLRETGVREDVVKELERRIDEAIQKKLSEYDIHHVILVVDVSGSMYEAINVTRKLYPLLSRFSDVDIVAFNDNAWIVNRDELEVLSLGGWTSVGMGLLEASKLIRDDTDAIVLISDCQENQPPRANRVVQYLKNKPLIIIRVGYYTDLRIDYPVVYVDIKDFHERLLFGILDTIARAAEKAREEETMIVEKRELLSEEVMKTPLPSRPPESLKPGFIVSTLTHQNRKRTSRTLQPT